MDAALHTLVDEAERTPAAAPPNCSASTRTTSTGVRELEPALVEHASENGVTRSSGSP